MAKTTAIVGVAEHGNSAELVTVSSDGALLDRRRIDLTEGLPTHPYHHEGSWAIGRYTDSPWAKKTSLPDAIALVERVHKAAAKGARASLAALAKLVPGIAGIAIRECPALPRTIEERIRDTRASNVADGVMYRRALEDAAKARGWSVHWYDRERVFDEAADAISVKSLEAHLKVMGKAAGAPWRARHKLAAAAAIATGARTGKRGRN
jgi:hypothetical protein